MEAPHNLIADFRSGDAGAFKQVYDMYYKRLYLFSKKYIENREDAKDLVADIFVKLWKHHASFETLGKVQSFLFIAAKNACLDYARKKARQDSKKVDFELVLEYGLDKSSEIEWQLNEIRIEVLSEIYNYIEKLSPKCREIFKLAYFEGLKPQAISKALGLSNQTVRNQLTNAIKSIRANAAMNDLFVFGYAYIMIHYIARVLLTF